MAELFTLASLQSILALGVLYATPYLFAALGEMFSQRSGVVNLGVEGIMLMGALLAFGVASATGNAWLALLVAAVAGALLALLMAYINISLRAEQGISGIGMYLLGLGMSGLLFKNLLGGTQAVDGFQAIKIPVLGDLPFIGDILFNHNVLVYLAFTLVPVAAFVLNKTSFGLNVRAVGMKPEAADSLGVNVALVRYVCVMLGGVMAGIAGASLSVGLVKLFQADMTAGLGFIAVALVYFGGWTPLGVMIGSLLFSIIYALQFLIQSKGIGIPSDLVGMLPYILTIVALAFGRRQRAPAALSKPYVRGEN